MTPAEPSRLRSRGEHKYSSRRANGGGRRGIGRQDRPDLSEPVLGLQVSQPPCELARPSREAGLRDLRPVRRTLPPASVADLLRPSRRCASREESGAPDAKGNGFDRGALRVSPALSGVVVGPRGAGAALVLASDLGCVVRRTVSSIIHSTPGRACAGGVEHAGISLPRLAGLARCSRCRPRSGGSCEV